MTMKTRQSGQPARVLLHRNKAGASVRTLEGHDAKPSPRVGLPPLLSRMERELEELRERVTKLESKGKP